MATTNNGEVRAIPYQCPSCLAKVADMVEVDGWVRIDDGAWLIADGKKHCHRCGRLIHFRAPRETWAELVERHLKRVACANGGG